MICPLANLGGQLFKSVSKWGDNSSYNLYPFIKYKFNLQNSVLRYEDKTIYLKKVLCGLIINVGSYFSGDMHTFWFINSTQNLSVRIASDSA